MASGSKNEEELRKLSMEIRYFEQNAEAMQQRLSMMNAAATDLSYANTTLEELEKEKENTEVLVPIGGSTYINAKLANSNKVLVGMGAGVSVEKTLPEAKAILKERYEELERTRAQAQQQRTQITERIGQDRTKMENMLAEIREGKQ